MVHILRPAYRPGLGAGRVRGRRRVFCEVVPSTAVNGITLRMDALGPTRMESGLRNDLPLNGCSESTHSSPVAFYCCCELRQTPRTVVSRGEESSVLPRRARDGVRRACGWALHVSNRPEWGSGPGPSLLRRDSGSLPGSDRERSTVPDAPLTFI